MVLELGTNHFGEIAYTAKIAQPDLAIMTNIGDSHLEFLKDRKGVLNEKKALFDETIKRDGKIFINRDDVLLRGLYRAYKNRKTFSIVITSYSIHYTKLYDMYFAECLSNLQKNHLQLPLLSRCYGSPGHIYHR